MATASGRPSLSMPKTTSAAPNYVSIFGGSTKHRDHEELALRFLPRLNPLARALMLTCRGSSQEVAVVSNLLVILCSEQGTQQVVNTGSPTAAERLTQCASAHVAARR